MSVASEKPSLPDDVAPPAAKRCKIDPATQWAAAVHTRIRKDPHFFRHALHPDTQRHWVQIPQREGAATTMFVLALTPKVFDDEITFCGSVNWDPRIFHHACPPDVNMLEPNVHGSSDFLEVPVNIEGGTPCAGWAEWADDQAEFRTRAIDMPRLVAKELLVPMARKMEEDAQKLPKAKRRAVYDRIAGMPCDKAMALCAIVSKEASDDDAAERLADPEPGQCTFFNGTSIKRDGGGVVYCKKNVYKRKSGKYPWEESETCARQLFNVAAAAHEGVVKWPFEHGRTLCKGDSVVMQARVRVCFSKTGISLRYEPSNVLRLNKAGANAGGGGFNICAIDYDAEDAKE